MLVEHLAEDEVAPRLRMARVHDRVVERRVLGNPRQQRRLRERQVSGALAEVGERGLLDPVGAVAEVDRVEVGREDAVLRPALLELPRERRLLELARDRALVRDHRVLDELLRDRRAALHEPVLGDVGPERARHPVHVDAAVLVEPLVLDRDDRLLHLRRDLARGDDHPCLRAAEHGEDRVPVARVDVAVDLLVVRRRVESRNLRCDRRDQPEPERRRPQHAEDDDQQEQTELADPPAPALHRRVSSALTSQQNA